LAQIGFDVEPNLTVAMNGQQAEVGSAVSAYAGPSVVTLESGIQALVQIARLAYIDGVPIAIGCGLHEDVDPRNWVKLGSDGANFERVLAAAATNAG